MPSIKPGLFLCLSFLLWPCLAQAAMLRDDPALAKPVTVYIKGQGLDVIVAKLSEVSGVKLRARDAGLADVKAAVFVRDVPLHDVMNSIAQNFNLSWRIGNAKSSTSYDLHFSARYLKSRTDYDANAPALLEAAIQRTMKTADEMTDEQIKVKLEELRQKSMKQGWQPEIRSQLVQLYGLKQVHTRPFLALYKRLTEKQRQALAEGYDLYFDTNSPESEWKLPADFPSAARSEMERQMLGDDPAKQPKRIGTYVRLRAGKDDMGLGDRGLRCGGGVADYDENSITSYGNISLGVVWPRDFYEDSTLRYVINLEGIPFDQKVKLTRQEIADEAGISWQDRAAPLIWMHRCDILGLLHKKTGIPIVSDYYQSWFCTWDKFDTIAAEIVNGLWRIDNNDRCWVNWNGRMLCVRTDEPWMMAQRAVSDEVLLPWQEKYSKDGQLGLEDLADMVRLPQEQFWTVADLGRFFGLGWRDDVPQLDSVSTVLMITHVLTPDQRSYALKHELLFETLSDDQKQTLSTLMFPPRIVRTGPKYGTYEGDNRIDGPTLQHKNDKRPLPQGLKSRVEKATDYSYGYLRQRAQTMRSYRSEKRQSFPTLKEAWMNALKLNPKATKQDLERRDTTTHIFTLREADGRIHDQTFPIHRFTPYAKLTEEEKLPETKATD
ncbi:MAG: hypothetical protein WCL39_07740 [Armatimonadota bacterium]